MATSFTESRLPPLVETDPKPFGLFTQVPPAMEMLEESAKPFGLFAHVPPAMEMLEEEFNEDASPRFGGRLRRSHSWAGYAAHRVAGDFSAACEVSSDAISKKHTQCGKDEESPCSLAGTPSTRVAASWASESEEDHEYELAEFGSPQGSASSRRAPIADFYMDTAVRASGATAPLAAAAAGARDEGAARQAPPGQAPQIVTTLMVQNLARKLTRRGFLKWLDEQGFADKYDFVHLPQSFESRRNNGFAFVNFILLEDAEELVRCIAGIKGSKMRAVPADVQGLSANATKASSRKATRVRNSNCRPLVVSGHGQDALLQA